MQKKSSWTPGPDVGVLGADRDGGRWLISAVGPEIDSRRTSIRDIAQDIQKFGVWLNDAQQSGIYAIQRFARTLRRDVDAARNALTEGWSNGQTEGQINRLKTLKRAMCGRASTELLRARTSPLHLPIQRGK
jgi:hypothetical protein